MRCRCETDSLQQELQQVRDELHRRHQARQEDASLVPPASNTTGFPKRAERAFEAQQADVIANSIGDAPHGFMERKPGKSLTFYTPGSETASGELTTYGNIDLSIEGATKGISSFANSATRPLGRVGWLPDISTNISYVGIRGFQPLGELPFQLVYQFETQLDISATSGTGETNSYASNTVKGALTSRNTYVGFASRDWGAIKFGKTDAPYKNSTMRMNPFYGMQGDYQVIMGNTGGDNRVEFSTRLDHSVWYESPVWGGVAFNLLYSPGQNRASNSDNLAAGESDCTGGNIPGSGGIIPVTCSDGSFSDALSGNVSYTGGRIYITGAYERHMRVNRSSDITGIYGSNNTYSQLLAMQDVATEDAGKVGVQYAIFPKTSISGIFETMHRYVRADLEFQNERQRIGTWFALTQKLDRTSSMSFGWAHAFRTPGDPGQHNDSLNTPPGGVLGTDATAGVHSNNQANLYTTVLKRQVTPSLTLYTGFSSTLNGPAAHYDLGAGGRGITTDCHDASGSAGGLVASNPHCFAGGLLQGASVGTNWKF